VTSQEPRTPHSADRDIPDTEVIVVSSPAPVFVDSTGRRRRLLRRLSYAFGGLCVLYGGLVSVSLAGGPVSSNAVLPLPDLRDDDQEAAGPKPAPIPAPSVSAQPPGQFITESLRRRSAPADLNRVAEPRPPAPTPPPVKTPTTAPTSAKPVESATVPSDPTPASPAPSATTPVPDLPTKVPPIVVPPAPPASPSSGGTGGGGQAPADDEADDDEADERGPQIEVSAFPPDTPESSAPAEEAA